MEREFFGTDGIRGTANQEAMTPESVLRIGMAAAAHFKNRDHPQRGVIGKDTRLSGYMLEPALTSGFVSMGMDVTLVGPLPTPAISMLTRSLRADLGVMLSASHNLFQDNGIKLFGPDGYKLSDEDENIIEQHISGDLSKYLAKPRDMGRAKRLDDAAGRYIEYVKNTFPKGLRLDGLRVVLDCANGAAYRVAPEVLWELGADIIAINTEPDGFNINRNCGSTNLGGLKKHVLKYNADIGLALDGDADRVLVCDEQGNIVDGDQILALIAEQWHVSGDLRGDSVVTTVMANLGLENYFQSIGLSLIRTKVGDRYVVEKMRAEGINIGGEQSGHIVVADYSTTGDGLIAALQILAILISKEGASSSVCRPFEAIPQLLRNVKISPGQSLDTPEIKGAIKSSESQLLGKGRMLVRKSGTEPIIRVMIEGEDQKLIETLGNTIVSAIESGA